MRSATARTGEESVGGPIWNKIGVLVYSGLFLSEDAGIQKIFKDKPEAGVRVRILLVSYLSPQGF